MTIVVREIPWGSDEYAAELALRTRILRTPLRRSLTSDDVAGEADDLHFGAFGPKGLVGCLLLRRMDDAVYKMRQVAVDAASQGLGVGRRLVEAAEARARQLNALEIQLNARETALPFYLGLGYEVFGPPLTELTLPHRKMKKSMR